MSLSLNPLTVEEFKPLAINTAFADFETKGLGGLFLAGGLVDMSSNDVSIFRSVDELWTIITERELKTIYFHNLEYDARYIIDYLIKVKLPFQIINRVTRVLLCEISIKDESGKIHKVSFIDSYALLTDTLKKLSKVFAPEYEKKTLDFDNKDFDVNNEKDIEYLNTDCLALKHIMINSRLVIHDLFGVNPRLTTSSTALRAWQNTLKEPIYRLSNDADEFVRLGYAGGLVFMRGVDVYENISVYDFNSMYPSVMRDYDFPIGDSYWTVKESGIGFYECYVNARRARFLFLNGYKNGRKYARCEGIFNAIITDKEITLARKLGYFVTVKRGLVFQKTGKLFTEFVNKCEQVRLNNSKNALDLITKYIQNSLYGKFGTKKIREEIFYSPEILLDKTPVVDEISGLFQGLYIDEKKASNSYMLPYLAAYTTALARCRLVECIEIAGIENVVYGDTDSLFVTDEGEKRIEAEKGLIGKKYGQVKKEEFFKYVLTVAPKVYFGKKKSRAKGFPARVIKQLEMDLLMGNSGRGEFTMLVSNRTILMKKRGFYYDTSRSIKPLSREVIDKIKQIGYDEFIDDNDLMSIKMLEFLIGLYRG